MPGPILTEALVTPLFLPSLVAPFPVVGVSTVLVNGAPALAVSALVAQLAIPDKEYELPSATPGLGMIVLDDPGLVTSRVMSPEGPLAISPLVAIPATFVVVVPGVIPPGILDAAPKPGTVLIEPLSPPTVFAG
ncbi:hypothetical protein [Streptacidiphilus rugosus]|uniref:hypothetical protein n=1 Tax=Streptacidiphilus rugosus TaxID=405783 RepID=UPI000567B936|nr:hypothetical protein [Streptacidiphilus rugosus]